MYVFNSYVCGNLFFIVVLVLLCIYVYCYLIVIRIMSLEFIISFFLDGHSSASYYDLWQFFSPPLCLYMSLLSLCRYCIMLLLHSIFLIHTVTSCSLFIYFLQYIIFSFIKCVLIFFIFILFFT